MLLIEEKEIPVQIELVPMRSYGDKPREFMQKVPNGLLPAMQVNGRIITESQVIMELLDQWHTVDDGYKPMLPDESDEKAWETYNTLARLEREYVRNFVWPVVCARAQSKIVVMHSLAQICVASLMFSTICFT
jgi:glutathione S-transferase